MEIVLNEEKDGVELHFDGPPSEDVLTALSASRFRYHRRKKFWYAKQTPDNLALANTLSQGDAPPETVIHEKVSLWKRVQYEQGNADISGYHWKTVGSRYTGLSTKETAAELRKHFRDRFPECKISVTSDYNSINVHVMAGPYHDTTGLDNRSQWAKQSPELAAIQNYLERMVQSYNYDDSDSYSDYTCNHFYGHVQIERPYIENEPTEEQRADIEDFRSSLAAFQADEAVRCAAAAEESRLEAARQREQADKDRQIWDKTLAEIEACAIVQDLPVGEQYVLLNCFQACKVYTLAEAKESIERGCPTPEFRVVREVTLPNHALVKFQEHLLEGYSFLAEQGGSGTQDVRIQSMTDYNQMPKEEQETVCWYDYGVAILNQDGELQFVVDPQGFDYARYIGITDQAVCQPLPAEPPRPAKEYAQAKAVESAWRESLAGLSPEDAVQECVDTAISLAAAELTAAMIQQVEDETLKKELYQRLEQRQSVQGQFQRMTLVPNEKFTLILDGDMGGVSFSTGEYLSAVPAVWAQYSDAVKLMFRAEKKRGECQAHLHNGNRFLLVRGYWAVPEELLWDIKQVSCGTMRSAKFSACDPRQLRVIRGWLQEQNAEILVDRAA